MLIKFFLCGEEIQNSGHFWVFHRQSKRSLTLPTDIVQQTVRETWDYQEHFMLCLPPVCPLNFIFWPQILWMISNWPKGPKWASHVHSSTQLVGWIRHLIDSYIDLIFCILFLFRRLVISYIVLPQPPAAHKHIIWVREKPRKAASLFYFTSNKLAQPKHTNVKRGLGLQVDRPVGQSVKGREHLFSFVSYFPLLLTYLLVCSCWCKLILRPFLKTFRVCINNLLLFSVNFVFQRKSRPWYWPAICKVKYGRLM